MENALIFNKHHDTHMPRDPLHQAAHVTKKYQSNYNKTDSHLDDCYNHDL